MAMTDAMTDDTAITCQIDGGRCHSIRRYLRTNHPHISIDEYKERFPDAPLVSDSMREYLTSVRKQRDAAVESAPSSVDSDVAEVMESAEPPKFGMIPMSQIFEMNKASCIGGSGKQVYFNKYDPSSEDVADNALYIPQIDHAYHFNADLVKDIGMAIEMNLVLLLWGHAGTGKSTVIEQFCARTNRPFRRIQHTASTEEAHIVGQTLANESGTYFEPGILPLCMKYGLVYLADEYDFASPDIHSVYQAVMEGKPLIIKEAPPEWRVVEPHPNFRFVATGNTNGAGDETGLYSGTMLGNSANYSRFAVTIEVPYLPESEEIKIVRNQTGVSKEDATNMVKFAGLVRKEFSNQRISATIGPREIINATKVGIAKADFKRGMELAYINRLGESDAEVVSSVAQRVFG
jgi:cobaltochelatase CobS